MLLLFAPNHFVDDGNIGLDDFDYYVADVFTDVDIDRCTVIMVAVHRYCSLYSLEERFLIDAGEDEAGVVERFGTLRGGADADGRERMTY